MYSSSDLFNKSIFRCENCNAFVISDSAIQDQNGEYIPLDLDHKRHCCSAADKIEHESRVVESLLKSISHINNTELTSFKLELKIVDG
jgi:hypothetical protein